MASFSDAKCMRVLQLFGSSLSRQSEAVHVPSKRPTTSTKTMPARLMQPPSLYLKPRLRRL